MRLNASNLIIIKRLLSGRINKPLKTILGRLNPADLAALYNQINKGQVNSLIEGLRQIQKLDEMALELSDKQMKALFENMEMKELASFINICSPTDGATFLQNLDEELVSEVFENIPTSKSKKLRQFLAYDEDSAGRLMTSEVAFFKEDLSAEDVLKDIRKVSESLSVYYIYCVDENNRLTGVASLRKIVISPPQKKIKDIAQRNIVSVTPEESSETVATIISDYDFIALPVVNKQNKLVGAIAVDDILDIIQEQANAQIYAQAGLQEDDKVYTSVPNSYKKRIPWMFLNLILAGIASLVVSLFEETMAQLIILASLKNIVAGTGGNTAIQTLTVVTRGLAMDDFKFISFKKAFFKEALVGLSIGVTLGISAGILVYVWKQDLLVSSVICISMILNSILASSLGAAVPFFLKKMKLDPAISSGVLVTISTDIFGFFSFLGIASLGLKYGAAWFG